jgi:hypothetical protein
MKRMNGGTTVKGGYYWHADKWEIVPVPGESGVLPGGAEDRFMALPLPMLVVVAPLIGLGYAFFLPAAGFALAAYALAKKLGLMGSAAVDEAVATMAPALRPGEAYFAGKPEEKSERAPEKVKNAQLDALEAEVEAKKGERP